MANESVISIIFQALDRATPTLDGVESSLRRMQGATDNTVKSFGKLGENIEAGTQPLANLAAGALKIEGAFIGAGVALTVFAAQTASNFDSAFRQISTLFDANSADVAKFRDQILEYAKTSSKGLDDITGSLAAAIGSGVEYSKSIELLATAEKLAVSTRADLKGTTEVLVSTLNAYGLKTEDAGRIADLFFQVIKDGKIEMNDLARSLAMVTPVAAAAGVDIKEVGAAVATLTAAGIQPSTAIEYLRSAISNIIKPSKEAADLAEELGIKFDAQALKSKGLAAVLNDVAKATGGNTGQMARLIGDVGGLTAALTLTGPQAEQFAKSLDSMGKSSGSVAQAFEKMAGSLEVAQARMANAFKVMLVNVGTPLLDEFGGVAAAITKIFNAIGDSVKDGALRQVVAYVESILGDVQTVLERVARNLPAALASADLSGFTKGIDAVRDAFGKLFAGIDLTTVDGLRRAVELAGTAFLGLSKFSAGVIESFKPLFDLLLRMGSDLEKTSPAMFELAGNISGVASQVNLLAGGMVSLLPSIEALLNIILLKQGIGLLGSLKNLASVLPAAATGISGVGLAITAYLASDKVIDLVRALVDWKRAQDAVSEANTRAAQVATMTGDSLAKFAQTTGIAAKSIDEAMRLINEGAVEWDESINGWVRVGTAVAKAGTQAASAVNPFQAANEAMVRKSVAAEKAAQGADKLAAGQKTITELLYQAVPIIDAATGKIVGYEQQLVRTKKVTDDASSSTEKKAKALKEQAEQAKKAEEAQERLRLELEKLASNERIKLIEARVVLNVAEAQEQTKRIQAAFESVNNTINSTADVINKAFGLLAGNSTFMDSTVRSRLFDQLDIENKNRERALKLQEQLTQAQIEVLRQQARQMERGDAIIKVEAAGLTPHLEAIWMQVLQGLQVATNRDGLKLLLGYT